MENIVEYQLLQTRMYLPLPFSTRSDEEQLSEEGSDLIDSVVDTIVRCFGVSNVVRPEVPTTTLTSRAWQFQNLRTRWHRERGATSSITRMGNCPAYQSIIAIGPSVIPHILRQLESEGDEPDMWFWALKALLQGYDPVAESDRGDFRAMAAAWLAWGRRRYAW